MRKQAWKIMQQYMTAIYSMTTVNPDHLFAAMLHKIPFNRINAFDLRRRVFLAVTQKTGSPVLLCIKAWPKTRST